MNYGFRTAQQHRTPLSNDQILRYAPSAGAVAPHMNVSDKYTFINTMDTVNILRDLGWLPVYARECRVLMASKVGYQKHMIRFLREDMDMGEESIDLCLYNSHDLTSIINLIASIWRKVCSNGMIASVPQFSFAHKHIGFDADQFVTSARQIAGGASLLAGHVAEFKAIELTPDERGVYAKASLDLLEGSTVPQFTDSLLRPRRFADRQIENTLWGTYNIVQENLTKGGLSAGRSATGRRRTTRQITSIDRDIKLNKALWTLTEEMKKIKTS